jgi:hypothetical protein
METIKEPGASNVTLSIIHPAPVPGLFVAGTFLPHSSSLPVSSAASKNECGMERPYNEVRPMCDSSAPSCACQVTCVLDTSLLCSGPQLPHLLNGHGDLITHRIVYDQ